MPTSSGTRRGGEPETPVTPRAQSTKWIYAVVQNLANKIGHHEAEVAKGALVALALKVLGAALNFGFSVLLGRSVGAAGAGLYFLAFTLAFALSLIARLGLDLSGLKYVAIAASIGNYAEVRVIRNRCLAAVITMATAVTALLFVSAPWLATQIFHKPDLADMIRVMAWAIPPVATLNLHAELLKGLKRIRDSQIVQAIGPPGLALLGLLMLSGYGVHGAVVAYTTAAYLSAAASWLFWAKATPTTDSNEPVRVGFPCLFFTGIPLLGVTTLNMSISWVATFLLGAWTGAADVGIFGIGLRMVTLVGLVLVAINSITASKFAELHKKGDHIGLTRTVRASAKLALLLSAPLLLIYLAAPRLVMGIFGTEFVTGASILRVLTLGQICNVATGSVGFLLTMTGHERRMWVNMGIAAALNLTLCVVLIPHYGAMGAAVSFAVSIAVQNAITTYFVFQLLRINPLPFCR